MTGTTGYNKVKTDELFQKKDDLDSDVTSLVDDPESGLATQLNATYGTLREVKQDQGEKLTIFRAALASRRSSPCNIWVTGDSITEGQGASALSERWQNVFADAMRREYPDGVEGASTSYVPVYYEATGLNAAATTSGTVVKNANFGLGGRCYRIDPGGYLERTVYGTAIDVHYVRSTSSGRMNISVDSVDAITALQTAFGAVQDDGVQRVTFASRGTHVVRVYPTEAFPVFIDGFVVYDGDENAGIRVFDNAHWGWATTNFGSAGTFRNSQTHRAVSVPPALNIITLFANDYSTNTNPATTATHLSNYITAIRAASTADPDFLFVTLPPRTGTYTYPWAEYVAIAASLAASDSHIAHLDLAPFLPPCTNTLYWDSGVHPTKLGHEIIGGLVAQFLNLHTLA